MLIFEFLGLDCREQKNRSFIQKQLFGIKPLQKYKSPYNDKDCPFDAIERVIHNICRKYTVSIVDIRVDPVSSNDGDIVHCTITDEAYSAIVVHGLTMYEVYSKACVYLWLTKKKYTLR